MLGGYVMVLYFSETGNNRFIAKVVVSFLFEKSLTLPFNSIWVNYKQFAADFYATDKCIGEQCVC